MYKHNLSSTAGFSLAFTLVLALAAVGAGPPATGVGFQPAAPDQFTVTVDITGQGSVEVDPDQPLYDDGDRVTFTPIPDSGWTFRWWSGFSAGELIDNGDGTWSLVVNGHESLTANFVEAEYYLSLSVVGEGTVVHTPGNPYSHGQVATLEPIADAGAGFSGWSGPDADELIDNGDGTWSLVMDSDKAVTATFRVGEHWVEVEIEGQGAVYNTPGNPYLDGEVAILEPVPDAGWYFEAWSGLDVGELADNGDGTWSLLMDGDKTLIATFLPEPYTLTISIDGGGSVGVIPDQDTYAHGAQVTLTAIADSGWSFAGWDGDLSGDTNPTSLTMDGSKAVVAHFAGGNDVDLCVSRSTDDAEESVARGRVSRYSSDLELVEDGGLQVVGIRFQDLDIPKGAKIDAAYLEFTTDEVRTGLTSLTFHGQASDDPPTFGADDYDISSRPKTTASVDWNNVPPWPVVDEVHQTPDLSPIVQETVDRESWVAANAMAFIVSGSGVRTAVSYDGNANQAPCLHVTYGSEPTCFSLTTDSSPPAGGTVDVEPAPNCGAELYTAGTRVKLAAYPGAGSTFIGWSGDLSSSANPAALTIDGDKSVTANFAFGEYTLAIDVIAGSGSVERDPDQATYSHGDLVTLTPVPVTGWRFLDWGGSNVTDLVDNGDGTWSITMDGDKALTASFAPEGYILTIGTEGSGRVEVDPDKPGYEHGDVVAITPVPGLGWHFLGWTGENVGDLVHVGGLTWTLEMDEDKSLTAHFYDTGQRFMLLPLVARSQ